MAEEIELKLALSPEAGARLLALPLIADLARADGELNGELDGDDRLESTYYDTPDLALKRAGMALRVRRTQQGYVQTVKAPLFVNGASDGLQRLAEHEVALPDERLDLALFEDEALQARFTEMGLAKNVEPVFRTQFDRRRRTLVFMDSVIELAVDSGEIVSGEDRQPLSEVELELKEGRPSRLFELGLLLHEAEPLELEQRSKAVRGYRLYSPQPVQWVKAETVDFPRKSSVAEVFAVTLRKTLAHLRANEAAVLESEDPEGVHQARVALRRLRALVAAFRPVLRADVERYLAEELRWLQQQLGPARDWDVFLAESVAPLRERLPGEDSLLALENAARDEREKVYELARGAIRHPRYAKLLLRLNLWLEEGSWTRTELGEDGVDPTGPAADFAAAILKQRARKVVKMGKRLDSLSEAELHRWRIHIKKLRYGVEFFRPLFPKASAKAYLKALRALQDDLGAINDSVTGQSLLDRLDQRLAAAGGGSEAVAASATGIVLGWQTHVLATRLNGLPASWRGFRAEKAFW